MADAVAVADAEADADADTMACRLAIARAIACAVAHTLGSIDADARYPSAGCTVCDASAPPTHVGGSGVRAASTHAYKRQSHLRAYKRQSHLHAYKRQSHLRSTHAYKRQSHLCGLLRRSTDGDWLQRANHTDALADRVDSSCRAEATRASGWHSLPRRWPVRNAAAAAMPTTSAPAHLCGALPSGVRGPHPRSCHRRRRRRQGHASLACKGAVRPRPARSIARRGGEERRADRHYIAPTRSVCPVPGARPRADPIHCSLQARLRARHDTVQRASIFGSEYS